MNENIKVSPDSLYGITKYNGEMLVKQLLGSTKTQTIITFLILMALEKI